MELNKREKKVIKSCCKRDANISLIFFGGVTIMLAGTAAQYANYGVLIVSAVVALLFGCIFFLRNLVKKLSLHYPQA